MFFYYICRNLDTEEFSTVVSNASANKSRNVYRNLSRFLPDATIIDAGQPPYTYTTVKKCKAGLGRHNMTNYTRHAPKRL